MSATTAENLRDLHELHQRAKALRDRLSSGPKTLAVRQIDPCHPNGPGGTRTQGTPGRQSPAQEAGTHASGNREQDRRLEDQAQPGQEERRVQGASEPDRARGRRQVEDRRRDPGPARRHRNAHGGATRSSKPTRNGSAERSPALQQQIDNEALAQKAQLAELESAIVQAEDVIPEELPRAVPPHRRHDTGPTRWPHAMKARAWAVSRRSRRRW